MKGRNADLSLDTRGQVCPGPRMAVREALLGMDRGQILEVLGTDPASLEGIAALVKGLGGEVLRAGPKGDREWFLIIKR
ncbi:MAG TPA: hypothetical protein EYP09_08225 [Anaerolineae bacterium]|nr:hypothetical protein [Anaerolineae bacterium]